MKEKDRIKYVAYWMGIGAAAVIFLFSTFETKAGSQDLKSDIRELREMVGDLYKAQFGREFKPEFDR